MALVYNTDFSIMQQSHGLFVIAMLLVVFCHAVLNINSPHLAMCSVGLSAGAQ